MQPGNVLHVLSVKRSLLQQSARKRRRVRIGRGIGALIDQQRIGGLRSVAEVVFPIFRQAGSRRQPLALWSKREGLSGHRAPVVQQALRVLGPSHQAEPDALVANVELPTLNAEDGDPINRPLKRAFKDRVARDQVHARIFARGLARRDRDHARRNLVCRDDRAILQQRNVHRLVDDAPVFRNANLILR